MLHAGRDIDEPLYDNKLEIVSIIVSTTEECNGEGEQGDGPSLVLLYIANENHKKIRNLITVCMKQSKLLLSEIS